MHWCESSPHCCWLDKKFGFKYSYANFLCMKEFSMNVNLALLSVYVAWNGSSPPRKQMAAQWHGGEWRRKKNNKKAEEIWVGNWWPLERQKSLANRAWCLRPRHGKAVNLCCSTALGLGLHRGSVQVLPLSPGTPWAAPSPSLSPSTPACPRAGHRAVPHPGSAALPGHHSGQRPFSSTAKYPGAGLDHLANVSGCILKSDPDSHCPSAVVLTGGAAPRSEQNCNQFNGFINKLQVKMLGLSMKLIASFYF